MRKFQRAAVVAAAVAGLSAFGAGVSFAGEGAPAAVTAVANAVAVGGDYYAPQEERHQPEAQPEEQKDHEPEQGYSEHQGEGE
ncbi:hypothetical protein ACF1BE_03880 [Streptomyces sp. NPDC014991]|uniref:hypothetical protein n=1 Tax=Streptomyces sp. NPDC014991 TaxID=3364935 RepID=UPI0036F4D6B4